MGRPSALSDWLVDAWLRRKQFEWHQQAIHIVNVLARAMNGDSGERKIASDGFLKSIGIEVRRGDQSG